MEVEIRKIPWYLSWKGLLGTKNPQNVIFYTRFGIHTFGMKYPIDVAILNNKGSVVKIKEFLQPNRLFFWDPVFNIVLELPAGTIQERNITLGKTIFLRSL